MRIELELQRHLRSIVPYHKQARMLGLQAVERGQSPVVLTGAAMAHHVAFAHQFLDSNDE